MENSSQTYWLHRISYEWKLSYPLIENGFLSIGWSEFSSPKFIEEVRKEGLKAIQRCAKQHQWEVSNNLKYLNNFVKEMKIGDKIIVPRPYSFDVYEIIEEKIYCINELIDIFPKIHTIDDKKIIISENGYLSIDDQECRVIDLGFFRRVQLVAKDISRGKYAGKALTSALKYRGTNYKILKTNVLADIEDAILRAEQNRPICIHNELLEDVGRIVLTSIQNKLSPDKFEDLVRQYYKSLGAKVTKPAKNTPKEGIADADAVAVFDKIRTIFYVQIKHHDNKTSSKAISQIVEWRNQKKIKNKEDYCYIAVVISSGDYSEEMRELAKANNVVLINGEQFSNMLLNVGFEQFDNI